METWIVQKADGKQRAACISSAVCLSLAAGVFTQRGSVETSTWKLSRPCGRPTATRGPWKKIIIPPFHSTLASLVNKETFLQIFFPYRTMANPRDRVVSFAKGILNNSKNNFFRRVSILRISHWTRFCCSWIIREQLVNNLYERLV